MQWGTDDLKVALRHVTKFLDCSPCPSILRFACPEVGATQIALLKCTGAYTAPHQRA